METITYDLELTDTFSGEANYGWVHREALEVPQGISRLALVRRAKLALGLTGIRCRVSDMGDLIELRPSGLCQVAFVTYRDN